MQVLDINYTHWAQFDDEAIKWYGNALFDDDKWFSFIKEGNGLDMSVTLRSRNPNGTKTKYKEHYRKVKSPVRVEHLLEQFLLEDFRAMRKDK